MRIAFYFLPSLGLLLGSCTSLSTDSPSDAISLEELFERQPDTSENVVKTCGWATKQFENVQITSTRAGQWRDYAKGFGVHWMEAEPYTKEPEWRCITGIVKPICGWKTYHDPDEMCVSTGYSFDFVIHQTELARR